MPEKIDMKHVSDPVYLDYNATTPLLPEVVDAMLPYLREHFGNPSSSHWYGRRASEAVARARHQVATMIGCDDDELIFTAGITEANNLAIRGVIETHSRQHIVTTVIEHPATLQPCLGIKPGLRLTQLGVDAQGRTNLAEARAAIDADTALVTVMHANNETGVVQPITELAELAHAAGALMHADAAQSAGKVPVRVKELSVDLLSIAGHKLYAPKGVGALYVKRGVQLRPFTYGSGQEYGLRSGTENVAGLVGFGVACEIATRDLDAVATRVRGLRDSLWDQLTAQVPGLALNGHPTLRLPNTLNVRFPGVSGNALLANTPEISASTGSACHHDYEAASAVILAMGIAPVDALGSVRLSIGRGTTAEDIALAAKILGSSWRQLTSKRGNG